MKKCDEEYDAELEWNHYCLEKSEIEDKESVVTPLNGDEYNIATKLLCTNCLKEYEVFDDYHICPHCGYVTDSLNQTNKAVEVVSKESDIDETVINDNSKQLECPNCHERYDMFDDDPICPYCGYEYDVAEILDEPDDETIVSEECDGTEQVKCPSCHERYEVFDDCPICPYCGCVYNEHLSDEDNVTLSVNSCNDEIETAKNISESIEKCTYSLSDAFKDEANVAETNIEPATNDCTASFFDTVKNEAEGDITDTEQTESIFDLKNDDVSLENESETTTSLFRIENKAEIIIPRCLGCMKEYSGGTVCPYCGYLISTSTNETYHITPGTMLEDRYLVGKSLGSGGFGVTYIGWDTILQRKVAIKEYLPNEFATRVPGEEKLTIYTGEKSEQFEIGRDKFLDEAQRLAKCNDVPGVVKIFDTFSANNTAYIVMELLTGETLKAKLEREGVLPVEDAVDIIVPVLDALEGVHGHGIIHRDIAPDNVFLCEDGTIKVIDFGAARYATTSYSRSLTVILKSGYAPEEQYRSHGEQGPWSDVYAAAATLYKMLTGITPPDAMERRVKDELRPSSDLPEWMVTLDKKYKHLKYMIATKQYKKLTGRLPGEEAEYATVDFSISDEVKKKQQRTEKREQKAITTYQRLTGSLPGAANYTEESYAANDVIKSIPKNIYTAMMNALNVYKDDRTQSAKQFKEELVGGEEVELLKVKNRKIDLGKIPNWMKGAAIAGSAVILVLLISVIAVIINLTKTEIYAPEIINMMTDEAEETLEDAKLEFMIVDAQVSSKVPANKVMRQDPYAGTLVEKGSVVKTVVSTGAEKVTVPNFVGMTKSGAEKKLEELGITAEFKEEYSAVAKGQISAQSVEFNSRIAVGTKITLTVSLGLQNVDKSKSVKIPNITGKSLEEAQQALEKLNVYVKIKSQKYSDKSAGTVLSQSVKAGKSVKEGSTVEVVISKGKETVIVPYVTYKTESEAIKLLEKNKLKYGVKYEYHDSVAKGNVISQSIKAETQVSPNTTISLVVSKGKKLVTVPNVVGKPVSTAMTMIQEKGLQVTIKEEHSDKIKSGDVIRQSPEAKKEVANGTTITIVVSKGEESITVPNVLGKSSTEAISTLESKGFTVEATETYSDTVASGNVISQSPSAGSSLFKGTVVKIVVSKGVQPVYVPDVLGKSTSDAKSSLSSSGLKVATKEAYSDTVASGKVISQSPSSGSSVSKGSTVTITISKGKEPTTVPNVVGKKSSEATTLLQNAGLKVSTKEVYSETVASGTVISQSPSADSSAYKSDTVTITVSKGKQPYSVPNVVGKTSADAKTTITDAGFKVTVKEAYSDTVASGKVISQSPSANSSAYKGDTVTITVSKGKNPNIVTGAKCGDNLTWELDTSTGVLTISGSGKMYDYSSGNNLPWFSNISEIVTITFDGNPTSIGDYAFWNCIGLKTITIPNTIKTIGQNAFLYCNKLKNISIPTSVTSIGNFAFSYTGLNKITIPNSVTEVGSFAFSYCDNLSSATISNSIASIKQGMFQNCTNLTNISIPDSVRYIYSGAFSECKSLSTISLPDSVVAIGSWAFDNCSVLKDIYIYNSNCSIEDYDDTISSTATIHGYSGSTAEKYAKTYNRTFVPIE